MKILGVAILFLSLFSYSHAQTKMTTEKLLEISHIDKDFSVSELDNREWQKGGEILIDKYWSGQKAPAGRQVRVRLLWSETALYIRFEANQTEPLVVSESPNLKTKTDGLWNRDVCEIFLAQDKKNPRKYFEFEIAPNGEWIDLKIHQMPDKRETDFEYLSGMQSAAKIEKDKVIMAMKIEWNAFGKAPKAGDIWLGNIFRCVGKEPDRGYLAWQPTRTKTPNFHVPDKFGEFKFVEVFRK